MIVKSENLNYVRAGMGFCGGEHVNHIDRIINKDKKINMNLQQ